MSMKNKLLTTLILSSSALTITSMINHCIKLSATSKNKSEKKDNLFFHWRLGDIFYKKYGTGKPILLIHDLHASSNSYQWDLIISSLSKVYTVYTIDLLGCGQSEKPYLTYTNYLYVQLISDFIKSEIGHRTNVIAVGNSGNFVTMACSNSPELFNRIILVNPDSILTCAQTPGRYTKFYKEFLDLPIIGTLLYHIAVSKKSLRKFAKEYAFYNPHLIKKSYIDTCYENAHLGLSPKSIYASVHCNYTNCNIITSLKKIDNSIYLIGGSDLYLEEELLKEYLSYNSAIEYTLIHETKYYPHMEKPNEFLSTVFLFLS